MQIKLLTNSVAWFAAIMCLPLGGMLVFAVHNRLRGMQRSERVRQAGGSVFLNQWVMEFGYWYLQIPARVLIALRVSPNAITLGGLAMVACGSVLCAAGYWGLAGTCMLFGSLADMLDGVVARTLGTCSDGGEYVDAMVDRYADIALFAGLVVYYGGRPWAQAVVLAALVGTVMVSYGRAKAESLAIWDTPGGPMRRAERAVYVGFGILGSPFVAHLLEPRAERPVYHLILFVCSVIAVLANISVWSMGKHTLRCLRQRAS